MNKQELIDFADFQDGDIVWVIIKRKVDGHNTVIRRNDGFSALELLGLSSLATQEVVEQMKGEYKPDVVVRQVAEKPHD